MRRFTTTLLSAAVLLAATLANGPVWGQTTDSTASSPAVVDTTSTPPADSALRIEELIARTNEDPTDADAWTRLGILYTEEGLLEDARDAFISALQAAPTEPLSHLNLGLCLVRMERWNEAQTPLSSYRRMAPDDVRGHVLLGRAYEETGQRDLAWRTWNEGLDTPSVSVTDKVLLLEEFVRSTLEDREPSDAELAQLAETLEARPELLATEQGRALRDTVEFTYMERARHAMDEDRPEEALELWAAVREKGSTRDAAWTQPTQWLLDQGRLDEARAIVQEARRQRPETAIVEYLDGRVKEQEGDLRGAAAAYQRAVAIDEDFPGVNAALGEVLASLGDAQGAADALARAVERGEGGAAASYNMGVVLSKKGQFSEAIPHLERAIEADPSQKNAYRALGTAYRKIDRFSKSAEIYQRLIDRFGPDASDLYQLAFAQAKVDRHRDAAENYAMVVALQPDNRLAHYNLGNSLLKLERFEKAAEQYAEALRLKPDWYNASYNLALSYQKMGELERAIEQYELTLEIRETYAVIVNMAICYTNLGDEETAEEYYRIANELKNKGR